MDQTCTWGRRISSPLFITELLQLCNICFLSWAEVFWPLSEAKFSFSAAVPLWTRSRVLGHCPLPSPNFYWVSAVVRFWIFLKWEFVFSIIARQPSPDAAEHKQPSCSMFYILQPQRLSLLIFLSICHLPVLFTFTMSQSYMYSRGGLTQMLFTKNQQTGKDLVHERSLMNSQWKTIQQLVGSFDRGPQRN